MGMSELYWAFVALLLGVLGVACVVLLVHAAWELVSTLLGA